MIPHSPRQWLHDLELEDAAMAALRERGTMNTDARRKASAAYHAKRTEAGLRKVTLWLSPEARDALDAMKEQHGSKDAAADAAIIAAHGPA